MKFQIISDSAADLTPQLLRDRTVRTVPFYVSLDGETYRKEGLEITPEQLYQAMLSDPSCFPKTSMPTITDFAEAFYPLVQEKMPILCICLTQKFSGSYQSALAAKNLMLTEFPDAEIEVLDSQLVTALQGLLVLEAAKLRDAGLSLAQALPRLEAIRPTGHIFFTTRDLKYLQHGGRISGVAYAAGSLLNLKPLLHFYDGKLDPPQICRGVKHSLSKVVDLFISYLKQAGMDLRGYVFGTGIGLDIPEYQSFMDLIQEKFRENNIQPDEWIKIHIGATIGVHTGPYPMGLGILKKCEL